MKDGVLANVISDPVEIAAFAGSTYHEPQTQALPPTAAIPAVLPFPAPAAGYALVG
jgi:hypothetical protein